MKTQNKISQTVVRMTIEEMAKNGIERIDGQMLMQSEVAKIVVETLLRDTVKKIIAKRDQMDGVSAGAYTIYDIAYDRLMDTAIELANVFWSHDEAKKRRVAILDHVKANPVRA